MTEKVKEILQAVRALSHDEYIKLREAMDAFDEAELQTERERATRDFHARGLTDDDIDWAVEQHRRERRP